MTDSDVPTCAACGQPCTPKYADFGIGPGEAWGRKFNDVQMAWCSDCCEADMSGFDPDTDPPGTPDPDEMYDRMRDERDERIARGGE